MIRTLIVEDEPAAKRFLTSMITQLCPDFSVVATADDGLEAIQKLQENTVDVVITDIQMAQMDGIALADWISREQPQVLTIIVSGHDDFAYAKGAIRARVVEYLLKPIVPADFVAVMEKLRVQVISKRQAEKEACLIRAARGDDVRDGLAIWGERPRWLGVVRLGGQSAAMRDGGAEGRPAPEDDKPYAAVEIKEERAICFALEQEAERGAAEQFVAQLACDAPYYTAFLSLEQMPLGLAQLPTMLRQTAAAAVLGLSQTLYTWSPDLPDEQAQAKEKAVLWRLHHAIAGAMAQEIKDAMVALFAIWEAERRPLVQVEAQLCQWMQDLYEHTPRRQACSARDVLSRVSTACAGATGFGELLAETAQLCDQLLQPSALRIDGAQLASRIEAYICEHIGEALSTQSVCAVFGISSSYLGQLFRRHVKLSFVEYVNKQRVEEAIRLLEQFPTMPLKDVAQALGFSDQFYFSKVFRGITGVPPSEYRKEC